MRRTATEVHKVFWKGSLREEPLFQQRFSLNTKFCESKTRLLFNTKFCESKTRLIHPQALYSKASPSQIKFCESKTEKLKRKNALFSYLSNAFFVLSGNHFQTTLTRCAPGETGRWSNPFLTSGVITLPLSVTDTGFQRLSTVRTESFSEE